MLSSLSIKNVVLIDHLHIDFKGGLCALTGETGAGKSILLDSLGLALGARSETRLVRKGADAAQVIASFEISANHPSFQILDDAGLSGDETLILRRLVTSEGRSKAFINDQAVSANLLRAVGDTLVEVHGQFDTQSLLNPKAHCTILDEYGDVSGGLEAIWSAWKSQEKELAALQKTTSNSRENEGYLREALEDIDSLAPVSGEEKTLGSLRESLMHREQVLEGLNVAYQILSGENDPVQKAWGVLGSLSGKLGEEGANIISALDRASCEVQEAVGAIQELSSNLEHSEYDLESIDDRLFALRAQARKHQCEVEELPKIRKKLAAELNAIEHADDALEEAMHKVEAAKKAYIAMAKKVSEARKKAGIKLDDLVMNELPPLKLEKAKFITRVEPLEEPQWGASGMDQVRFLVATNPGADPGPLNKIASGGEMARFMLALKVVMADVGAADTLVFDEIDAGVGGSTADAVGMRLAMLAKTKQVMVVTHAPQVAARANNHMIVRKDGVEEVNTNIVHLESVAARREEIARMLSGASITEEARAAADKLLETGT